MDAPQEPRGRTRTTWPVVSLVGVFVLTTLPLILSGAMLGRYAWDQINYHEPVVRGFARQWPSPDLSNYLSATTPLYHLVLAAVGRFVSSSPTALQLVGSLFTLGLIVTMALALARTATAARVFVFSLLLFLSHYVFTAGVWMLPDNAAWWGVLGILLIAWRCRFDATLVLGGGVLMVVLVLTRQSHLWAAAALWASAWMSIDDKRQALPHQRWRSPLGQGRETPGVPLASLLASGPTSQEPLARRLASGTQAGTLQDAESTLPRGTIRRIFTQPGRRLARMLVVMLATLPAFGVVWWFRELWGGRLYPPCFDIQLNYPPNPAMTVFILAVFGTINVFFAGFLVPKLAVLWKHARLAAVGIALVAIVLACLAPSNPSIPDGRFGGVWSIAAKLPIVADRSLFIVAMAVWGVFALVGWCAAMSRGARVVVLVAFAGFTASQAIGHLAFQRYCEPLLLMVTILLAARTPEWPSSKVMHRLKLIGPATLALALAGFTAGKLAKDPVAKDEGITVGNVPPLPDHVPPPLRPVRAP
jgi:hypothetical protein